MELLGSKDRHGGKAQNRAGVGEQKNSSQVGREKCETLWIGSHPGRSRQGIAKLNAGDREVED